MKLIHCNIKAYLLIAFLLFSITGKAQQAINVSHVSYTVSNMEEAVSFLQSNVNAKVNYKKDVSGIELQRLFGLRDDQLSLEMASLSIGSNELRLLAFSSELPARDIPHDKRLDEGFPLQGHRMLFSIHKADP